MTPRIHPTPPLWCPSCGLSWRADMIAVALAPNMALVCGDCVIKAANLVIAEQVQRAADANALHGERTMEGRTGPEVGL